MPATRIVHFNPRSTRGMTACGHPLAVKIWTEDSKDVTCGNCTRTAVWFTAHNEGER